MKRDLGARVARLEGRGPTGYQIWDSTDRDDGRYECPDAPGVVLAESELDAWADRHNVRVIALVYTDT